MDDSVHSDKGTHTHRIWNHQYELYTQATRLEFEKIKINFLFFPMTHTHRLQKQTYLLFAVGVKLACVSTSHPQPVIMMYMYSGGGPA